MKSKDERKKDNVFEIAMGVTHDRGFPVIESRARPIGEGLSGLPRGKVLVLRTPILPPWASDEEIELLTERELVDDDGVFCPFCAAEGGSGGGYEEL